MIIHLNFAKEALKMSVAFNASTMCERYLAIYKERV